MTETATPARYRFVPYGGGVEELDRLAVRDRIRGGDIEADTELSLVGSILSSMISLWVMFYASHLLGYAVYRHAPELGWE